MRIIACPFTSAPPRRVRPARPRSRSLAPPAIEPEHYGPQWFLARFSRIVGSQPPRIVVAHDNITPLKQAQDTLRDGQALLLDMAASIPGAMFRLVRELDGRWRFTYFSPGLLPLFGLTPEQACADIRALGRAILPDDRPAHDETIRAAVAAGQPFEQEYRIRTADGLSAADVQGATRLRNLNSISSAGADLEPAIPIRQQ
jgi:PAS domain-containing protein